MKALTLYRSLGAIDARNVARDSLLRWTVLFTPAFGLVCRFLIPPATGLLDERLGFDLIPYYPLVMSVLPLAVAGMLGTVGGFLLLDQRDDRTLDALLVTPLSLTDYLRYRMVAMVVPCLALSWVTVVLAGLTETTPLQLAVTAIVAAPLAPIYALFLASFAANKVQGFALVKAAGIVLLPCIAAYFVTAPWQIVFGIVPQYWPMKVFWLFDAGAVPAALAHGVAGLAWQGLLVAWLTRRFSHAVRQ